VVFEIFLFDDLNSCVHDFFEIFLNSLLFVFKFHRKQNPFDLLLLIDSRQIFINIPWLFLVRGIPKHSLLRKVMKGIFGMHNTVIFPSVRTGFGVLPQPHIFNLARPVLMKSVLRLKTGIGLKFHVTLQMLRRPKSNC
jgi:hypothetical protein